MSTKTNYITAREALQHHEEGKVEVFAEYIPHGEAESVEFNLSDYDLSEVEGMACDESYKFFID